MFKMTAKRNAPHLNRAQRRHPSKAAALTKGFHFGANWLLASILLKGGFIQVAAEAPAQ